MIQLRDRIRQRGIEIKLTELQQLAFWLVVVFVVVILAALIIAAAASYLFFPPIPALTAPPPNPTAEQIIAHNKEVTDLFAKYQELQGARFATIGTTVVSTIFLPSLTLILGYLFGKQS